MLTPFSVIHPVVGLHREGSENSALETQLLFGELFNVEAMEGDWAFGQAVSPAKKNAFPGYRGYVHRSCLTDDYQPPLFCITALAAPLFEKADIKSKITGMWSMNARFAGEVDGQFIRTHQGYVHGCHVRSLDKTPDVSDFVTIAEMFLGRPYIWGGVSSDGLDCSGLVQTARRAAGYDAPRDSSQQIHMGEALCENALLRRGDLIFWKGHVGIMRDAENLLHANAYHMVTASELLSGAVERIGQQYGPITARKRLED